MGGDYSEQFAIECLPGPPAPLEELVKHLISRAAIFALAGGVALAAAQAQNQPAQQPNAQPPRDGDYQDIWLASELTVNALTAWVQTASFRQEVAAQLPPEVNITALGIAADNERSVGQLELRHPDSDHLAVIAAVALPIKTRLVIRSGAMTATRWATAPPSEWPTSAAFSMPRASMKART